MPGLTVIGALAYRGCTTCVTDSAVPPHVTPPTDVRAPPLVGVTSFQLKPGDTLTLLLSVKLASNGRVHVPPLRIDLAGNQRVHTFQTVDRARALRRQELLRPRATRRAACCTGRRRARPRRATGRAAGFPRG